MKPWFLLLIATLLAVRQTEAFIIDEQVFQPRTHDSLAPRDEWGLLHQSKDVRAVDFAPRQQERFFYYFLAPEQLMQRPAYVGALQRDLKRLGYYCGPIDGFYSPAVSVAIAQMQKNYSFRVTGNFNDQVRHALRLP